MQSIIDAGPPPPCPPQFNLAAHVLAAAQRFPERIALELLGPEGADRLTYAALEARVRGCGTGLLALGLMPEDRVLMRLGNSVEFPVLFLGAIAAGLVPVPTSAQLTAREIGALCATLSPALIVADASLPLPPDLPCRVLPSAELTKMASLPPVSFQLGDPNRLAYIIFTSGTSGRPQAVMHAHRAILARAMMMTGWYDLRPDDRVLHAGAFNWTYTLGTGLMDPWTMGATALIPMPGTPSADLPGLLARHEASLFAAAPGVYRQMLRQPFAPCPKLRHGLSAGESLPPALRARWQEATGTDIHEAFGMSEISTFLSGAPGRPAPTGCTGFAQPGRKLALLDGDGAPVPFGTPGIIAIDRKDPGLFLGYLDDPTATEAKFSGPWYLTGDTAEMTPEGAIRYLGRADDMMNAGGYRVSPLEVEAALTQHPEIAECAVVELAVSPEKSIIACAFVPRDASAPPTADALSAFAESALARYKQPRHYCMIDALPRNPNGKINRRLLRQTLELPARNPAP
ncbi:MAG: class I adenylate-forming enzyme family protein [Pseudorhodobacter sp.]|nr:class I adenylate-forming enzyme family protein [Pseudorhodobacter sp.]